MVCWTVTTVIKNKQEKVERLLLHIQYQRRVMFEQTSNENEGVSHFEQRGSSKTFMFKGIV